MTAFIEEFTKEVKAAPQIFEDWKAGKLVFNEAYYQYLANARAAARPDWLNYKLLGLAERINKIDPYEARDTESDPQEVADVIESNPAIVIEFLLDYIDHIEA